jgi:hypothetical protein
VNDICYHATVEAMCLPIVWVIQAHIPDPFCRNSGQWPALSCDVQCKTNYVLSEAVVEYGYNDTTRADGLFKFICLSSGEWLSDLATLRSKLCRSEYTNIMQTKELNSLLSEIFRVKLSITVSW